MQHKITLKQTYSAYVTLLWAVGNAHGLRVDKGIARGVAREIFMSADVSTSRQAQRELARVTYGRALYELSGFLGDTRMHDLACAMHNTEADWD